MSDRNGGAAPAMRIDRMKAIDLWLGLPLCTLAGVAIGIARRLGRRSPPLPTHPRSILVMKFFGAGSVIQAGPMLRAIRRRYPDARLSFLSFNDAAHVAERMQICDEVRAIRTAGFRRFAGDVLRQIVHFWREPADLCVDLEFFSKFSTLMSVFSGAPIRVAFHLNNFWRWSIVTHPVYYNYYRHVGDVYADAAAAIGAPVDDLTLVPMHVPEDSHAAVRQHLLADGWDGRSRLVGVNVNAGELSLERRWPMERFVAVIERLAQRADVQPVLTGTAQERAYVQQGVDQLSPLARERTINAAGRWSFDELLAGVLLFEFLLTNDSGPVHIASAQGVDTISLWGVGRPSFYGPRHGNHCTFYRQFACSPCLYMFTSEVGQWCNHRGDCMRAITVDEVWGAVANYLDTAADDRGSVRVLEGW